jgi:hypothetical protein
MESTSSSPVRHDRRHHVVAIQIERNSSAKCAVFRLVPQFVYSSPVKLVNKMLFSSFCSRMSRFNPAKIFSKMLDFSYCLRIRQFASIQILQQNVRFFILFENL